MKAETAKTTTSKQQTLVPVRSGRAYDIEARKIFLEIDAQDGKNAKALKPLADKNWSQIIGDLYNFFLSHEGTSKFFQGEKHVANLKQAQGEFFMMLLGGVYDNAYQESRLSVGRTHERIGLEPE